MPQTIFRLDESTDVTLDTVTPRKEHHGKDTVVAVTLGLTMSGPNTLLDLVSPSLRHALYTRDETDATQEPLEGIEPPMTTLRSKDFDGITLPLALKPIEGGTLSVEWGISDDIVMTKTKVDKFRVTALAGGTVSLSFRASSNDIDDEELGHVCGKLGQVIAIRFEPPAPIPESSSGPTIDGTCGHPGARDGDEGGDDPDAGDLFARAHGVEVAEDVDGPRTSDDATDDARGETEDEAA